jgi:hypothetical protein
MSLKHGKITDLPVTPDGDLDGFRIQGGRDRDDSLFENDAATQWLRSPEGKRKAQNLKKRRQRANVPPVR